MSAGRPMSEAPRDGAIIIAEVVNHYGIPATGHYEFARIVAGENGSWHPIDSTGKPQMWRHMGDGCFARWWPDGTPEADLEKMPRTNWNFQPSNGTGGEAVYEAWCSNCIRERAMREDYDHAVANGLGCEILARTMAFSIGDPEYPTEWTYDRQTGQPKCTAREVDAGQPTQEPRCTGTLEMFPEAASR